MNPILLNTLKVLNRTTLLAAAISASSVFAESRIDLSFIDLTHDIPTFAPSGKDATKPDLQQPIAGSTPIAGFYHQAVLYPVDKWSTSDGHFESAALLIQEHNGTSFNAGRCAGTSASPAGSTLPAPDMARRRRRRKGAGAGRTLPARGFAPSR